MIEIKTPVFRASECGNLIKSSRAKHESGLSQTGLRTVAKQWLKDTHGIKRTVTSKEMRKGILCEENALTILSDVTRRMYVKNTKRVTRPDLHLTGECDIDTGKMIIDTKVPWDAETFIIADLDPKYVWQLRAYMLLYDRPKAQLAYVLCDLPPDSELYHDEYRRFCWNAGIIDDSTEEAQDLVDAWDKTVRFGQHPNIATDDLVKLYTVERDDALEQKLIEGLKAAADVYNSLTLNKKF